MADARRGTLAWLMAAHPVRLARMMGYDRLVEPLHDGWIRRMTFGDGDWTLQAHRGSYKTTCVKVALWLLLVTRPRLAVGFFRKASPDVEEVMAAVARMLRSDASAMATEVIYGRPARIASASSTAISTDLACNASDLPQLSGYGIGGSLTGKHYDVVFTDDVVTLRDRASRAEREATKAFYRELQNVRNRGGRIVNTGTPWHRDDAFALMPEPERWPWDSTGLVSDGEAAGLRRAMTRSLFAANYELRHVATEGAVFEGEPGTFSDRTLLFDGLMHVDAAYGGADGTAVTCIAWHDGRPHVHGELFRETHVDRCVGRILELHESLRLGTVWCERNADRGYLAEKMRGMGLPVSTYQETANKFVKISTHARGRWSGLVRLDSAREASCAYWDEVMDYGEGAEHDDAPDSLACAIRLHDDAPTISLFRGGI